MADQQQFISNGILYDGTSWRVQLPQALMFERIFRELRSFNFNHTRTGVSHRLGTGDTSNGGNRGRAMPDNISMGMTWEVWRLLMPRLSQISPEPGKYSLALVNFVVTLRQTGKSEVDTIEVFDARFLGPEVQLQHDQDHIPINVPMFATNILVNGMQP